MNLRKQSLGLSVLALSIACFAGCSSSDDPAAPANNGGGATRGVFLDSAVDGMSYTSGDKSGTTDTDGTFNYDGSSIEFKVGDITIGQATPAKTMTPINLVPGANGVTDQTVTNIARFLQTIDDDADPTNGIKITAAVRNAAAGASLNFAQDPTAFEQETNVQTVVSSLTSQTQSGQRMLVTVQAAQDHLSNTLAASFNGSRSGVFCVDNGNQQSVGGQWSMTITDGAFQLSFSSLAYAGSAVGAIDVSGNPTISGTTNFTKFFLAYDAEKDEFWGRWYRGEDSGSLSESTDCTD